MTLAVAQRATWVHNAKFQFATAFPLPIPMHALATARVHKRTIAFATLLATVHSVNTITLLLLDAIPVIGVPCVNTHSVTMFNLMIPWFAPVTVHAMPRINAPAHRAMSVKNAKPLSVLVSIPMTLVFVPLEMALA